ncbi:MAG TPA: tetratricopeptide repeat protein [Anaerohalosphaeraceae bacterium]|nr:tetratricopeptide repeat protein [Anaerohalosphaeraceae bacterium]
MRTFKNISRWAGLMFLMLSSALSASFQQDQLPSRKLRSIARLYMAYGQYDKAEGYLLRALQHSQSDDASDSERAICMIDLATLYSYQDRLAESEELFWRGLAAQQNALGPDHPYVAHTLRNLTAVYIRQHRLDRAAETLEWAFDIILKHHTPDNRILTPFYIDQAALLTQLGAWDEAEAIFTEMLEKVTVEFGQNHLYTAQVRKGLAELYLETGQYELAAQQLRQVLAVQQIIYGQTHRTLLDSYLLGAKICRLQGDLQQMQTYFDKALSTVISSGDTVSVARLYEQIDKIRSDDFIIAAAAAGSNSSSETAG